MDTIVLRRLRGSLWYATDADGEPICDYLVTGATEIAGRRGVPEALVAGEQVGRLFCPYQERAPLFWLSGRRFPWPKVIR